METTTLHRRLIAVVVGIAIAISCIVAYVFALPEQAVRDENADYGYVYSGAKSSSVDFIRANLTGDTLLVLGSSEFSTPASTVPQVPAETFGMHNYGLRLMLVGEAFDQSLWDAIALGALSKDGLPKNKVALIVGLGMFTDGGLDSATFNERFSYTLYRGFCENPNIEEGVKAYVRRRLREQGVEESTLRAADPTNLIDATDGIVLGALDDLRLRKDLLDVREKGMSLVTGKVSKPNWARLLDDAETCASLKSRTNDWGVEDDFYTNQLAPALESLAGARAGETYTDTPEYEDLKCYLDVCGAMGLKTMIVIEPVLGPYYDHIGITRETREAAYQRIRDLVAAYPNASLADFSPYEYEPYFLFDIVHFGWTGWVRAESALYDFAMGA